MSDRTFSLYRSSAGHTPSLGSPYMFNYGVDYPPRHVESALRAREYVKGGISHGRLSETTGFL
jgi:hypothetical protein